MSDEMQPGEIQRALRRIEERIEGLDRDMISRDHARRNELAAQLAPIAIHGEKIETLKEQVKQIHERIDDVSDKVEDVTAQANKVSGIGAVLAILGAWVLSWFKH